jgi:hypothetical protein
MTEQQMTEIADAIVDGLTTDGAHHKQECLERALEALLGKENAKKVRESVGWEPGIPVR